MSKNLEKILMFGAPSPKDFLGPLLARADLPPAASYQAASSEKIPKMAWEFQQESLCKVFTKAGMVNSTIHRDSQKVKSSLPSPMECLGTNLRPGR